MCLFLCGGIVGKIIVIEILFGEKLMWNDLLDVCIGIDEEFLGSYVILWDGMLKVLFMLFICV